MAGAGAGGSKQDYYELLGVSRDADEDDIKRAYRKLALVWHPDKNAHRLDEATEKFKEIQAAYATLSDEHERSWYDTHSEEILSGGHSGGGSGASSLVNVFEFFSRSCYEGMDDGKEGFFTVYKKVFADIAAEEKKLAADRSSASKMEYPSFGTSSSSFAQVSAFYNYWTSFSSKMHFAWADQHNPSDAPNRDVRRAMERDNESFRRAAARERNDQVRELASFVQKRDPRVAAMKAEERRKAQQEEEERQAAKARAKAAAAKAREENAAAYAAELAAREAEIAASGAFRLADLSSSDDEDAEGGGGRKKKKGKSKSSSKKKGGKGAGAGVGAGAGAGGDAAPDEDDASPKRVKIVRGGFVAADGLSPSAGGGDDDEEEEEEEEEVLMCVYCNKSFKSPAAMDNHERSKKHLQAVAAAEAAAAAEAEEEEEDEEEEEADGAGADAAGDEDNGTDADSSDADDEEVAAVAEAMAASTLSPSAGAATSGKPSDAAGDGDDDDDDEDDDDDDGPAPPPRAGKGAAGKGRGIIPGGMDSDSSDGKAKQSKKKPNKTELRRLRKKEEAAAKGAGPASAPTPAKGKTPRPGASAGAGADGSSTPSFSDPRKFDPALVVGGSKGKPMAARAAAEDVESQLSTGLSCAACKEVFDTRNGLFAHIKATGHAVVKDDLLGALREGGLGGYGGSGGKAAAKKEKNRAKRMG
jgi:DnaJ family protein A protein 5